MAERTFRGRQKIEIKKIEKKAARDVTFSKRRVGVFGKASELATLCGVDIGVVAFSPAGRPYTFGHPDANVVFNRFLGLVQPEGSSGSVGAMARHRAEMLRQLTLHCSQMMDRLAAEREKRAVLEERLRKVSEDPQERAWPEDLEGLGLERLARMVRGFEEQRAKARARLHQIRELGESSSGPSATVGAFSMNVAAFGLPRVRDHRIN
ncbi:agamous-like MADS-box protein AGL29 [Elaeis guineensis]|uniref:Agamous-like MADS-box protein AGL29 n=1 Tax=Elaeis guineensis var. tenera TaxID=51953 RepID=A0A6I9S395_ELAGV|nr:agamous-like MADS-box protein AGL29 [Elaeis guineensis]